MGKILLSGIVPTLTIPTPKDLTVEIVDSATVDRIQQLSISVLDAKEE